MKITLEMDRARAIFLMRACEVIARIGMGQFKDMVELLNPKLSWDERSEIENYLKGKIYPELSNCISCDGTGYRNDGHGEKKECSYCIGTGLTKSRGHYHAMHSSMCPEESQVAWDAYQHIRREISWIDAGKDWRTDERDWTGDKSMIGVSYDEPLKTSKLPGDFVTERLTGVDVRPLNER